MSAASGRKRVSPSDARRIAASGDLLDPVGVCVRIDHVNPWHATRALGGVALVIRAGAFHSTPSLARRPARSCVESGDVPAVFVVCIGRS